MVLFKIVMLANSTSFLSLQDISRTANILRYTEKHVSQYSAENYAFLRLEMELLGMGDFPPVYFILSFPFWQV